ncbi:bifunctional tetrahydrofolate synthase/dihydrofolate synthase [Shewanella intestini]|uniref:bifunctional tetrahydrofolate synthase/dihydrofolate synthase n=1 Tax=Shewanella TaxID=22 RepID=UPI001E576705|nr:MULTISPECIES: bifunctional tetrahydrofolate synthase/dihydrofolate synthase [Shewanella]
MNSTTAFSAQNAKLDQWLEHLLAIHPSEIDMGLSRVALVGQRLGITDFANTQVITVAGTNGKGTTCAMLESILRQAGKSVGVYSSPHIHLFNERFRINQQNVTDAQIITAFNAIEVARAEISLTYFEFATLAALWLFTEKPLDVVLLEVGLGGRLDATNIVDSNATIITAIDLDHQEYLGDTREAVGREKAGIMRENCLSIIGEPDIPASLEDVASQIGSEVRRVGQQFSYTMLPVNTDNGQQSWAFSSQHRHIDALPVPSLPLPNAASVVALVSEFWPSISNHHIANGLQLATLPGRIEQVKSAPVVLLDVAHNPHAALYLAQQLKKYNGKKIHALCGMLKDKDMAAVLACLEPVIDHWNLVSLDNPRGACARMLYQALPQACQRADVGQFDTMDKAWETLAMTISADDVLIVFGSFFTVAAMQAALADSLT